MVACIAFSSFSHHAMAEEFRIRAVLQI